MSKTRVTTVNVEAKRMAGQPQLAENPEPVWEHGSEGHLNLTSPVQCEALGLPPVNRQQLLHKHHYLIHPMD